MFLVGHASAGGWDDFANNIGSDLAPLITLFGEQVTNQYLSETLHWIDCVLFALAPLGIITAIVGAIRVGGGPGFRSLIGRAKESRGSVEADMMSSVSTDVCELWNGEAVVRVLGKPVLLQLIYIKSDTTTNNKAGIYTLEEAAKAGLYKAKFSTVAANPDRESLLQAHNVPNLSLNVSMEPLSMWYMAAFIILGTLLESGVLVFAAFVQYRQDIFTSETEPTSYAFPTFLLGSLLLAAGMFFCAHVIESSTTEATWTPIKDSGQAAPKVIWLQQGGQTVGDQLFEPFARIRPNSDINTSWKSDRGQQLLVSLAVGTSLSGFVLQFVGLRALHPSVIVAQLGVTLIMTAIRSCAHIQRDDTNDIKKDNEMAGNELDWLAKRLAKCESWTVSTGLENTGYQFTQAEKDLIISNAAASLTNKATEVMKIRARLVELSSDWSLESRTMVLNLKECIEKTMDEACTTITLDPPLEDYFEWHIRVESKFSEEPSTSTSAITLKVNRTKHDNGKWSSWRISENDLEAILSIWSSCDTDRPAFGKYTRLLGPDTIGSRMEFQFWIQREAAITKLNKDLITGLPFGCKGEQPNSILGMEWDDKRERMYAQEVYTWFVFQFANRIRNVGGETTRRTDNPTAERSTEPSDQDGGKVVSGLINSNLAKLADIFKDCKLGNIEQAYSCLFPAIRASRNTQVPHIHKATDRAAQRLQEEGRWEEAAEIYWWMCDDSIWRADTWIQCVVTDIIGRHLGDLIWELESDPNNEHSKLFDLARLGCRCIPDSNPQKLRILMSLFNACSSHQNTDLQMGFLQQAIDAGKEAEDKIPLYILLQLAKLALERGPNQSWILDAESLARYAWVKCVKHCSGSSPALANERKKVREFFVALRIKQNIFLDKDEITSYLSQNNLSTSLCDGSYLGITIQDRLSINASIPFDLLIMDSFEQLLYYAIEHGIMWLMEILLISMAKFLETGTSHKPLDMLDAVDADRLFKEGVDQCFKFPKHEGYLDNKTILQVAAENGQAAIVDRLLEAGADCNAPGGSKSLFTALQSAVQNGHAVIVEQLLEAGADVNFPHGRALVFAIENDHTLIIGRLLEAGADANAHKSRLQKSPLEAAAMNGNLAIVDRLLKLGIDANSTGDTAPALRAAAENGHLAVVDRLLEASSLIKKEGGQTALVAAAKNGQITTLKRLLQKGANFEPMSSKKGTALQAAAGNGHVEIVDLLLKAGAIVDEGDEGEMALHVAANYGHEPTVARLLKAGASSESALSYAVHSGNADIVDQLLKEGAKINFHNHEDVKKRDLVVAASGGHAKVVDRLLESDALDMISTDEKLLAICSAAKIGHASIVNRLLDTGINFKTPKAVVYGCTALEAAARVGNAQILERLLGASASFNGSEQPYSSALRAAALNGHAAIVDRLLEIGAGSNKDSRRDALEAAVLGPAGFKGGDDPVSVRTYTGGHAAIVERLLVAATGANATSGGIISGMALDSAAYNGNLALVNRFLTAGADLESRSSALYMAANNGNDAVVELLLDNGATAHDLLSQFGGLVIRGRPDITIRILDSNAMSNFDHSRALGKGYYDVFLQGAAREGLVSILDRILELDAASKDREPREWEKALISASQNGNTAIVARLLSMRAGPGTSINLNEFMEANESTVGPCRTALQAAAENGNAAIVKLLLEAGADANTPAAGSDYGRTALQAAAENGYAAIVNRLLEAGAKVNETTHSGRTTLCLAAEGRYAAIVNRLLEAGENTYPALPSAAKGGYDAIVNRLLEAGADVNALDCNQQLALQIAAEGGHASIVNRLLEAEANVNIRPSVYELSALQAAAKSGYDTIVNRLLEAGADVDTLANISNFGRASGLLRTALDLAIGNGHAMVVNQLLEFGANVNFDPERYTHQDTPLQAAAKNGFSDIVELLLNAGADPNSPAAKNGMDYAEWRGHYEVVKLFSIARQEKCGGGEGGEDLEVERY